MNIFSSSIQKMGSKILPDLGEQIILNIESKKEVLCLDHQSLLPQLQNVFEDLTGCIPMIDDHMDWEYIRRKIGYDLERIGSY